MRSFFLCLSLMLTLHHAVWADITTSLVAHWPFDSATTTTADVVGGNTATLVNTPAIVAGKISNGLEFVAAENDRLDVADHASLDLGTGDFTIAFWVQAVDITSADFILVKGAPATTNGFGYDVLYRADLPSDPIALRVNHGTGTAASITGDIGDITSTWFHIAFACDRDVKCDVYKDGTDIADDTDITTKATTIDTTTALCIASNTSGNNCTTSASSLNGKLDDLRIYKRYLSAGDVAELVALGSPVARRIFTVQ